MRTEYKHNPPIPYSLHDMRVKKIIMQDQTIVLEFEDGYKKLTEPFLWEKIKYSYCLL